MAVISKNTICMLVVMMMWTLVDAEVKFTHKMELHEDYVMHWKFSDEHITVKLIVNTTGWVGWGLSPSGAMKGADVIIAWVDSDGNNHFHDRYAEGRFQPSIDQQQDYNLLKMTENNSTTEITFKRKLQTGDDSDMPITQDTMRVLWSWNDKDPRNENDIQKHKKRGSKSALLLDYGAIMAQPLPKQYDTFDLRMKDHNVHDEPTVYWCKTFKIPDMGANKQHIVRIDPIITQGNELIVHHMLVYECLSMHEDHVNVEHHCRNHYMPDTECTELTVHGWAVGATSFYYPPKAGFSLNTKGDPKYLLLEIHYDNPDRKKGIEDSSGFRFFFTEELRDEDSGIISAGSFPGGEVQVIPQHQDSFTTYGFCSSKCFRETEKTMIYAVFPHAHLQGRKITARMMNEKTGEEVLTIHEDASYDFNFQEVRYLKDPIQLLPGHRIDIECTYETNNREKPVSNGLGTKEEMCLVFIYHYPRLSLKTCWSNSLYCSHLVGKQFGYSVNERDRINASLIVGNKNYLHKKFNAPLLDRNFWMSNGIINETKVKKMELLGEKNPYYYMCRYDDDERTGGTFVNAPRVLLKDRKSDSSSPYDYTKWYSALGLFVFSIGSILGIFVYIQLL